MRPAGVYEAPALNRDTDDGVVVEVHGEDGRRLVLQVDRLPLPGWHRPLAAALAVSTGVSGQWRTITSAKNAWYSVGRLTRFLQTLTDPPADPTELTVAHLEAFQRYRAASTREAYAWHDLRLVGRLLGVRELRGQVRADVLDYTNRRVNARPEPKPGYSDRELDDQLVKAARTDVATIRDRIRAGATLLDRYQAEPHTLDPMEHERAGVLASIATTGAVPQLSGLPVSAVACGRRAIAGDLFLTMQDMPPLLVLLVAVTGRNVETIKELPVEHRVLEGRAVELRIVKRRHGQQRWFETVTWEIGAPSRQLHTPGGLYLLVHELARRGREISGSRLLWSVWRNGYQAGVSGAGEHHGMFDNNLQNSVSASNWAKRRGLTADLPPVGDDHDGEGERPEPTALRVDFNRLKTSIEVRRTKQLGGHLPSAVRSNTIPVLFRNYLRGDPTVVDWAQEVVAEALVEAEQAALAAHQRALDAAGGSLRVVPGPVHAERLNQAGLDSDTARRTADGELDTAWSACTDHDQHPTTGKPCRESFLDCFHCGNCLVTRDHLPRLLGLLDAFATRRQQLSEADWWARYGMAWAAIRRDVLSKFSSAEITHATTTKPTDVLLDLVENPWEQP